MNPSALELAWSGEIGNRPDGVGAGLHEHPEGELSWLTRGIQRVVTAEGTWVVPASFAVWVPRGVVHDGFKRGDGPYLWLKFGGRFVHALPERCCAVWVSPSLAEVASTLSRGGGDPGAERDRLEDIFSREIRPAPPRSLLSSSPSSSPRSSSPS